MKDFLTFRRMLTPVLIQILFWLGILACLWTAVMDFIHHQVFLGFLALIIGPVLVRVICEILIIFFRINQTLTEIRNHQV